MKRWRSELALAWRLRNRLTQVEAADAIGVCRRTWCNYEQGTTPIPAPVELACRAWEAGMRLGDVPARIEQLASRIHSLTARRRKA